jgi:large subunit ribosomal protein L18
MSTPKARTKTKNAARQRRHDRLRKKVRGSAERPRLVVFRSNTAIYAQVIDDERAHTVAAASSIEKDFAGPEGEGKIGIATAVGKAVAERAKAAGVDSVVFDRGGNRYHGRVKALAEGAREGGLEF